MSRGVRRPDDVSTSGNGPPHEGGTEMDWLRGMKRRAVLGSRIQHLVLGLDHLGYDGTIRALDVVLDRADADDAELVQLLLLAAGDRATEAGERGAEALYGLAHYVQARRLAPRFAPQFV